ncbi:MAG: hypothetical protein M1837_001929 [Sclerophora amabilis]|nr:MAG: hypothetical protein M1837_001929 [Sclerophora amabilis]
MDRVLYFAYGSNLWLAQMDRRCPENQYLGVAILRGWRWMINERRYANIVRSEGDVVYGLLYSLSPTDRARLDRDEGVPDAYTRHELLVEWLDRNDGNPSSTVESLVYVDLKRTADSVPYDEYIGRMNKGIADAVGKGMPQSYVDEHLRKSIPVLDVAKRE